MEVSHKKKACVATLSSTFSQKFELPVHKVRQRKTENDLTETNDGQPGRSRMHQNGKAGDKSGAQSQRHILNEGIVCRVFDKGLVLF